MSPPERELGSHSEKTPSLSVLPPQEGARPTQAHGHMRMSVSQNKQIGSQGRDRQCQRLIRTLTEAFFKDWGQKELQVPRPWGWPDRGVSAA